MSKRRTSSDLELLVALDRSAVTPLHRQLEQAIREAIRDRRLPPSTELPSTRALAAQLRVSRGIVVEAYEQLVAEGYLAATPGGATRVSGTAAPPPVGHVDLEPAPIAVDFRPGRPDVSEFPRAVWLRSLRRVLAEAPSERLTYLGGWGVPELRVALATYLNRARGTCADPADVVVCSGFAQGLALVARTLRARGVRRVGVEDPSDPEYRATLRAAGLEPVGVPLDEDGLRVDHLEATDARAVIVTAAHQYPTGAVLPPGRRAALVDWATAPRRLDPRGRLRRRVPLRPRADRRDPGPGRRPRRLRGFGEQGPRARAASRLAARAARAHRPRWSRPSRPPTWARRRSTSSRSPTSSSAASSTTTCAGCARSTGGGATPSSRRSPATCPTCGPPARRPGSTCSPGSRTTSTRRPWSRPPRPRGSPWAASGRGGSRPDRAA